jgi:phosphatidylserine decarboxylase
MSLDEIIEPDFIMGKALKVSVFLLLFNIHINRSPISGIVRYMHYRPGKFLPAFKSHASDINEKYTVGIENEILKVLVHQITGFIARRIVCKVGEGDKVKKGQRSGMIKFGSCTEIVVPLNVDIKLKVGDKAKAGSTIIGIINSAEK